MSNKNKLLVIDSAAMSLRVSYFEDEERVKRGVREFTKEMLEAAKSFDEQIFMRRKAFIEILSELQLDITDLSAIVARLGYVGRLQPGAYRINDEMVKAVKNCVDVHPAALSIILANDIMQETGIQGYTYNSLFVSKADEDAFYSQTPEVRAKAALYVTGAFVHAEEIAKSRGRSLDEMNIIVVGAGFVPVTIAFKKGKVARMRVDRIRMDAFVKMPLSKEPLYGQPEQMSLSDKLAYIRRNGLMSSYIGTMDADRVNGLIEDRDQVAMMCIETTARQSAIGVRAAAAAVDNAVDEIVVFGPATNIQYFNTEMKRLVGNIAPITTKHVTYADHGMARGILRVLRGEEYAAEYISYDFYLRKLGGHDLKIALVAPPAHEDLFDYYTEHLSDFDVVQITYDGNDERFIRQMQGVSGMITMSSLSFSPGLIKRLDTVKVISLTGTGVHGTLRREAKEAGIIVCNIKGYSTEEVAEHNCALILALSRNLQGYVKDININHHWDPVLSQGRVARLSTQQLGILGLGRTGLAVARRMAAFGIRIVACDPAIDPQEAERGGIEMLSFEDLLRTSDIITCNFPSNEKNRNLIGKAAFASMHKHPVFINCASGFIVDEDALLNALDSGQIRAAGIDVFQQDPPDFDGKYGRFLHRDNVIVTPHAAFYSDSSGTLAKQLAISNLRCALNGDLENVRYIVNGD